MVSVGTNVTGQQRGQVSPQKWVLFVYLQASKHERPHIQHPVCTTPLEKKVAIRPKKAQLSHDQRAANCRGTLQQSAKVYLILILKFKICSVHAVLLGAQLVVPAKPKTI